MNTRTKEYIKRRKTFTSISADISLKGLLKAEFFSTSNIIVKRDILKAYTELNKLQSANKS